MQIQTFTLPIFENKSQTEELNKFLRGHKIIDIENRFVENGEDSCWCFSIRYILGNNNESHAQKSLSSKPEKIDYKNELSEAAFTVFTKLREIRKQVAQQEAIPAYAVFTDAELAEISKLDYITSNKITEIRGIGAKRAEKYAHFFQYQD